MLIEVENKFNLSYPPKYQLLKWVGSKHKSALSITRNLPRHFNNYFEPFLGSGAILATISPKHGIGSDTFAPLIEIWQTLVSDPQSLIDWYAQRRNRLLSESKEKVYVSVRDSYNADPNGPDFLFLSRSCYGGVIRFRKADGYMSTPCGAHDPISVDSFENRVKEWYRRLHHVTFLCCDYKEIFNQAKKGDLIYCDPPYSYSQGILYGAQSFRLAELLECIENAKGKGVKVALSIDGQKKSGDLLCDIPLPKNLFENEILIDCGISMLKRFQIQGKKAYGEQVLDRLLLTY
ncbi:MAG TPA: Dam family site-specific DNA-(adenine-N6)-methyltransferase [Candidatus Kapabacteria bacterium]|nr:Dam family site-specific DNA-(adenine-N6)-methyltransferase [Candidatus Kapabacteria bacterium]